MKKLLPLLLVLLFLGGCEPQVEEPTIPQIRLNGDAVIVLKYNADFEDPGAFVDAEGEYEITVGGDVVNTREAGNYFISYSFDYEGETYTITRNVLVQEMVEVDFYLLGNDYIYVKLGDGYTDPGYHLSDVTIPIYIVDNINMNEAGVYMINFQINANNEVITLTRMIEIVDLDSMYDFYLLGAETIYHPLGDSFDDPGYFHSDEDMDVDIDGWVDIDEEGTYTITYSYTDKATDTLTRTIIVIEDSQT